MPSQTLSTRVIRGLLWTGSPFFLQIFISILFYATLETAKMGQFEYALVIVMLLGLVSSLGFGEALIQDREVTEGHFSSAFWFALLFGLALTGIVVGGAPAGIRRLHFLFEDPPLFTWILSTLVLLVPFASVSGIFRARLQRDLQFRAMAFAEVAGVIVYASSAILLLPSQGIGTPVLSAVIREVGLCLSLWVSCRWLPKLTLKLREVRDLTPFGLQFTGSRCVNYINSNLPRVVVYNMLGSEAMGYFAFAVRLTLLPLTRMSTIITRVFFPTFAAVQGDDARLRSGYLQTVQSIALFGWPLMAVLYVFAPDLIALIRLFKDNDMSPALVVLQLLLVATALKSIGAVVGSMFMAKGRAGWTLNWSIFSLAVLVPALLWGASGDIDGVAAAIAATSLLFLILSQLYTNRLIQLRPTDYLGVLVRPTLVTGFVFGVLWALRPMLPADSPIHVALSAGALAVVTCVVSLRLFAAPLCRSLWTSIRGRAVETAQSEGGIYAE